SPQIPEALAHDQQPTIALPFVIPLSHTYNRNLVMGTHTVYSAETARPRTRIWRLLGAIIAGLMVLVVVGIGWFLSIARAALPELDGLLPVAGVSASVSVSRDAHGVPTIESATLDDLFFAQGYVT